MRRPHLPLTLALAALSFAAAPATEPTTQPAPRVLAEFPIARWGAPITVPVIWAGRPACFVVDTGASVTVLDPVAFPDLKPTGDSFHADTLGGATTMRFFAPPDLQVGPFPLAHGGPVTEAGQSDFRAICDQPVIGMLGVGAFRDDVLQIDFDAGRLRVLSPDDRPHPEWGRAFPLEMDGRLPVPTVELSAPDADQAFRVDTGLTGAAVSLTPAVFDRWRDPHQPISIVPAATGNGVARLRLTRAPAVALAGVTYRGLICGDSHSSRCRLGLDFLERHLTTIDFSGRRLYLRPGAELDHRTETNMAGLRVGRSGKNIGVRFIDADTPAARAGLRPGDVLVDLDGRPAAAYTVPDVRDLLSSRDGRVVAVTVRRGDATVRATLTLHRVI